MNRGRVNRSGWHVLRLDKNTWLPVRIRQGATGYEAMSYTQAHPTQQLALEACRVYNERDNERQAG